MFGGFGIFAGDTMFALVVNNTLHLRANCNNEGEFKKTGAKTLRILQKKDFRLSQNIMPFLTIGGTILNA